jgi:hypothetical protein
LNALAGTPILALTSSRRPEVHSILGLLDRFTLDLAEGEAMNNLNLVVRFELAGDGRIHVKRAARIKVDGRGGLTLYDARGGAVEAIDLGALKSFQLQRVCQVRAKPAIPVCV